MSLGRPLKWKSPEEMQPIINKYFEDIEIHNAKFAVATNPYSYKHPTVTGLAIALNLTREGLLSYEAKSDEFSDTIKAAKAQVEEYIEQRLYGNSVTGVIFNLKNNFKWKDSQDVNLGGQNGENPVKAVIDVNFIKPQE